MKTFFYTIFILFVIIIIYIVIPHLYKKFIRFRFFNSLQESNDIYLTFDDGPDPESTPLIINALNQNGFKATFFITGKNGQKYPDLVKLISESGNTIGMHGYNHLHPWKTGPLKTIQDLRMMKAYFYIIDPHIKLYRPPYGKYNIVSLFYFLRKKIRPVFWNIDPEDYHSADPQATASEIIRLIKPGSVILLHDGRDNPDTQSPSIFTVSIVQSLIQYAKANNLKISGI
jgi:peptidoglycan/xylan/chitin deacetylase (PgdA/CDA1 family)